MKPSALLDPREQISEPGAPTAQQGERPLDAAHRGHEFSFRGPWFDTAEAAAYLHCPTREAFRKWSLRRGVVGVRKGEGGQLLFAKADIDRALVRRRKRG